MKTFITAIMIALVSTSALAGGNFHGRDHNYNRHPHGGHHSTRNWVAPLVVGAVIGGLVYSANQNQQYQPQYQHRPMVRRVDVYIPECNCYRTVEVYE